MELNRRHRKKTLIKGILQSLLDEVGVIPYDSKIIVKYTEEICDVIKPQKKEAILYWANLVKVWFDFNKERYNGFEPTFNTIEQGSLKEIILNLKRRTEAKDAVWDNDRATATLYKFLDYAHKDNWLYKNFLLKNINSHFDKIIKNRTHGTTGVTNTSQQSAFDKINKLS